MNNEDQYDLMAILNAVADRMITARLHIAAKVEDYNSLAASIGANPLTVSETVYPAAKDGQAR